MLDVARARCVTARIENVDFREGDFSRVPVAEGHVDVALAILVLHHVPSPSEALEEMFRIVKPGGRILVVEQQAHELGDFFERMQDHWWGFEPDTLSLMVEDVGFTDTRHFALAASNAAGAPGLFALTASKPDAKPDAKPDTRPDD
jgi:ArsR family transcriptional regulator